MKGAVAVSAALLLAGCEVSTSPRLPITEDAVYSAVAIDRLTLLPSHGTTIVAGSGPRAYRAEARYQRTAIEAALEPAATMYFEIQAGWFDTAGNWVIVCAPVTTQQPFSGTKGTLVFDGTFSPPSSAECGGGYDYLRFIAGFEGSVVELFLDTFYFDVTGAP